ncbi:MAG TPA: hypothetical protein PKM21_02865 [Anaerolineales bacterium]|nr:hypothetical protein [Anaerolineales bacterium]
MNPQIVLTVVWLFFGVKWGYELKTGKKLRKNLVGGPLTTREENPKLYWGMLGLEAVLMLVLTGVVFFTMR